MDLGIKGAIASTMTANGSEIFVMFLANVDTSSVCSYYQANYAAPPPIANTTVLELEIESTTPPISATTYPVSMSNPIFGGALLQSGAMCQNTFEQFTTSGSITFTQVSSAEVKGTYDLTFPGGTLSGSFDAPVCPNIVKWLSGTSLWQETYGDAGAADCQK